MRAYRRQRVLTSTRCQIMYIHHTSSHLFLFRTLILWSGGLHGLREVEIQIDSLVLDLVSFLCRQLDLALRLIQDPFRKI
jgi:RecA-family ATPase